MTPLVPTNWTNISSFEELEYLKEDLREFKKCAFDTETTGLTLADRVFGVSFAVGDTEAKRAYWFNFNHCEDEDLKQAVLEVVRYIFQDGEVMVIMHNAAFDIKMVRATFGIEFTSHRIQDSMLLAIILCRFPRVGLKELTRQCLGRSPVWAEEVQKTFARLGFKDSADLPYVVIPNHIIFPYACEDTINTFDLFYHISQYYRRELPKLQDIYKLERQMVKVCADLEFGGMVVDLDYFYALRDKLNTELEEDLRYFSDLWWNGVQIESAKKFMNSSTTLSKPLFDPTYPNGLKLDDSYVERTLNTHELSLRADSLRKAFPDHPVIQRLLMYKFRNTVQSRFVEEIIAKHLVHSDGENSYPAIHTNYWQIKDTGRLGSSKINLQNLPNDKLLTKEEREYSIRRGFVAPPGYLLVTVDFKSFEVAILANASQDPKLVADVMQGIDFHSTIGAIAYHRPYEELRNHVDELARTQRTQIKKTSFLFIYGGGVRRASEVNGIPIQEAEAIKTSIEKAYPLMVRWRLAVRDKASQERKVYTLCGRLRRIEPEKAHTTAVNTVCQGTAADVMKYGHVDVLELLRGTKSRQAATIHDEIHFYMHPDDWELMPKIVECLERQRFDPPTHYGEGVYVPMKVELSMGDSWGTVQECTVEDIQEKLRSMQCQSTPTDAK